MGVDLLERYTCVFCKMSHFTRWAFNTGTVSPPAPPPTPTPYSHPLLPPPTPTPYSHPHPHPPKKEEKKKKKKEEQEQNKQTKKRQEKQKQKQKTKKKKKEEEERNRMTASVLKQEPNTERLKGTLICFNTDTQYAHFRGNPLYQATQRHLKGPITLIFTDASFRSPLWYIPPTKYFHTVNTGIYRVPQ